MSLSSFLLILTGVLLNAAAQLMLKAGANRIGPVNLDIASIGMAARDLGLSAPIAGGIACYVLSVVIWIIALTRVEVSIAYPMLSIGYVVNAIAAWMLFSEALTPLRLAGIVVIIFGVFLLASSARGT
jgi:multidrug transporter EmrE-like cation transporter